MYNNRNSIPKPQTFLKTITIIFSALVIGQVLFGVVAFFDTPNKGVILTPGNDPFFYIAPALAVSGCILGMFLFKQQVAKLEDKQTLVEKLGIYQTALITRYACSEGPSLFAIVCYLLTGNLYYLIIAGLNVIYFIWMRPTQFRLEDDLNLSYEDKMAMETNS
jgi:hypothetical protein